jgi:hypothetical protein
MKPYRAKMDLTLAVRDDADLTRIADEMADALDVLGVQIESASFERMEQREVVPGSPLAAKLRAS